MSQAAAQSGNEKYKVFQKIKWERQFLDFVQPFYRFRVYVLLVDT